MISITKSNRKEQVKKRLEKIIKDTSRNTFSKAKKQLTRDPAADSVVLKDENGVRHYAPDAIKECTARYYESLYKRKPIKSHPCHQKVDLDIAKFNEDKEYDNVTWSQG